MLEKTIAEILEREIKEERKEILKPLIDTIQHKIKSNQIININFICTHNSRRSHLSQVWAQVAAHYYQISNVFCYSGGTEETNLFPKVIETLKMAGLNIQPISGLHNPIYSIKYDQSAMPIIGFSKKYDHHYNPKTNYIAVMTCSQADDGCPFIIGADKRIPITYDDPKLSDHTEQQDQVYKNRSLEIASEMFYVFSQLKK